MALGVKNPPANAEDKRDECSIPGSGRLPGVGNGTSLQYFSLKNSMNREHSELHTGHGVTKSGT